VPFKITITEEAESQLNSLGTRDRAALRGAIAARRTHQPATETRAIKRLRPNPLVQFELRVGDLRVSYNVEKAEVVLLVIGKKVGNKLIVKGKEFYGHQDDSTQPPGGGPAGNA
jgi:mRNA-degrading endonuclease RelE of RelBE toxin-antitoxin system